MSKTPLETVRERVAALLAVALIALLAVATTASARTEQTKRPITIGVNVSLSGGFAALGTATKNGIVLRARQINAKGGIRGRKIALRIVDDATNPNNAITNTNRLIDEGVDAIIGWNGGQVLVPASPAAVRRNVLSFSLSGYNEGMLTGPTLFFAPPTFGAHIKAISCFLTNVSKPRRVGIIATNDAGSQGVTRGVEEELKKAGMSVSVETVPLGAADVTVAVSKIRDFGPDLIFVAAVAQTGALSAKTVRDLGMKQPIFGWLAWGQAAVLKLYPSQLRGVIHEAFLAPLDPLPRQETFVKTYQRNYNALPDAFAAWAYDSVSMIGEAFRRVPNATQKDGVRLARAIEGITYEGAAARWQLKRYDPNDAEKHTGMQAKDVIWMVVRDGDLFRLKKQPKACTG